MATLPLDLSKFKKVSSDKHSTTMEHEDGHKITLMHESLHPKMRAELARLPASKPKKPEIQHFEDGGMAQSEDIPYAELEKQAAVDNAPYGTPPVAPAEQQPIDMEKAAEATPMPTGPISIGANPEAGIGTEAPQAPEEVATPPVSKAPTDQPAAPATPDMMHGYQSQMQGLQQAAQAEAAYGRGQAQALQKSIDDQQKIMKMHADNTTAMQNEYSNFIKDVQNQHIDPNRYLANMSTGQKILSAIGLIAGGIGGGLTHQENPAMKFINSQIERDIEGQKLELGRKETLLSANMKHFQNMEDAVKMTHAMMTGVTADKLKLEAAKVADPLAKARLLTAAGQLESQVAPTFQQLAMRQTLMKGGTQGVDPASFVPYVVPKEHQKEALHEIGVAQNAAKNSDEILKNFDQAAKENTLVRTVGGLRTPASILGMRAMMLPIIHDAEGRVNEFEQKTTSDLEPKQGDTDAKIAQKRAQLINFLNQKKSAPTAKAYGIDLANFASTGDNPILRMPPQQQAYYHWAVSNINSRDPAIRQKAALTLKKLGVQ